MILKLGPAIVAPAHTLASLAVNGVRQSTKLDLGVNHPDNLLINVQGRTHATVAITDDGTVDLQVAFSHDGTLWPAGVTGTDGAWTGKTVNLITIGSVTFPVTANNTLSKTFSVPVWGRWVVFLYTNSTSQALHASSNQITIWNFIERQTIDKFQTV